jgi:hypothetical protein
MVDELYSQWVVGDDHKLLLLKKVQEQLQLELYQYSQMPHQQQIQQMKKVHHLTKWEEN